MSTPNPSTSSSSGGGGGGSGTQGGNGNNNNANNSVTRQANGGGGGGSGNNKNRRRRNNNRNRGRNTNSRSHADSQSKSRSPSRDDDLPTSNAKSKTNPSGTQNNKNSSKSKSPTRNQNQSKSKSRSPTRNHNNGSNNSNKKKSKSPTRGNHGNNNNKNKRHHHHNHHHHHHRLQPPAAMTVISNRCDLWDSAAQFQQEQFVVPQTHPPNVYVNPYWFEYDTDHPPPPGAAVNIEGEDHYHHPPSSDRSIFLARVPYRLEELQPPPPPPQSHQQHYCDVIDNVTPNPHDPNVVHGKYWAQRRRLFSKFDQGIQLDPEGWYSVTPEIIADHVASRVASLITNSPQFSSTIGSSGGATIVDAFCGCGGNSIAFGKIPSNIVSKVVCIDKDRSKLLKAAHNASIYNIPRDKLIFVECNSIFILKYCYRDGEFILDQPTTTMPEYMPPPVMPSTYAGYQIGGLDLLPRNIDLAFFDPPWGGVDYEVLGKNGYDLEKNMKIQVSPPVVDEWSQGGGGSDDGCDGGGVSDDFFDTFSQPKQHHMSKNARKKNFNKKTEGEYVNGKDLVTLAAAATRARVVLFDLPRNTSKTSLGVCALAAGYRGNIKLEEHYLNGRLKTVTAYLGSDYSSLINDCNRHGSHNNPHDTMTTNTDENYKTDNDDEEAAAGAAGAASNMTES